MILAPSVKIHIMASRKVIVFGPTGAVGSAAARTAEEMGAKVVLAMRDTQKSIPGLSTEKEKAGNFERVQADLTKPDTVREAVSTTGAKHAFVYLAWQVPDAMRSTIEALKTAGIESVVFLSSFSVLGDIRAIPQEDVIPYLHAQVEINLTEVFGSDAFVAVRPGSFASNVLQYMKGIEQGEVKIFMPDAMVDGIVQEDIGRVSGTILAKGPQDSERAIYLLGPELIPQKDTVRIVAKAIGKDPKIGSASAEEAYKSQIEERGLPPFVADYMVRQGGKAKGKDNVFGYHVTEEMLSNVQKYSGKRATRFEEWTEQNKHTFTS